MQVGKQDSTCSALERVYSLSVLAQTGSSSYVSLKMAACCHRRCLGLAAYQNLAMSGCAIKIPKRIHRGTAELFCSKEATLSQSKRKDQITYHQGVSPHLQSCPRRVGLPATVMQLPKSIEFQSAQVA